MRPKILTIALILAATPAYADGQPPGETQPNHDSTGLIDKATRDNNKAITHDAAKYGEPDGSGGWVDGHTAKAKGNLGIGNPKQ